MLVLVCWTAVVVDSTHTDSVAEQCETTRLGGRQSQNRINQSEPVVSLSVN